MSYTFHAVFRVEKCKKDDNRDANSPQISNPRSMEKKARVCWSNSAMREYRGALFLVESWEKSSLDRPALPPPPCVVGEAQQNGSRGVGSPQWQYGRPVRGPTSFCPRPTGFLAHTASLFPLLYACPRAISSPTPPIDSFVAPYRASNWTNPLL